MTACPSCAFENPEAFRFCGRCGVALGGAACPSCGAPNPPDHRFCGSCGSALAGGPAAPAVPVDERKLATVLFADVVGFTSMAERTDPETVARTVDAAFRRLAEVVADHGGTVDKYMGDSLMAVFGVPQTHDDDAERAVAAALAMREAGGDLAFSMGVNTGEVLVTRVGDDGGMTVIGDAVNVAARLEKAAGAGQVLVGRLTADLAGDRVVFRERDPIVVKGRQEPVDVCEAVGLRGVASAGRAANQLPLVGRDDELRFLRGLWDRVRREGRFAMVLVTGDAGVGKTRLVDELAAEAESQDALVARASYPAYGPMGGPRVAAQLVEQLGDVGDDDVDVRLQSIRGEMHPSLRSIDPAAFRQEQFWAFRRLLAARAAEQPVLIVIDHMHRAGDMTLGLLAELAVRISDLPLLLVFVGRPEPSGWLTQFPSATTVRLGPLTPDETVALTAALVLDRPLAPDAASAVAERSGGNPLYARELVAMLHARGQLEAAGDHYRLVQGLALPPSLQAILAARLDALAPDEKLALQHLAVLGHPGSGAQVAGLGPEGVANALRNLVRSGLIRQAPDGSFDIADPLLREVAYETLPRHVRGERHRRAATLSEGDEERARHLDRAATYLADDDALRAEAADALAHAGCRFLDLLRPTDAVRLLERAVELGHREPTTIIRLAEVLGTLGRTEDGLTLLPYLPDDGRDPVIAAERAHIAARATMFKATDDGIELFDEAARLWREQGNSVKEGWAYANKGAAMFNLSRMDEAAAALEQGLEVFKGVGHRPGELAVYTFLALVRPTDPRVPGWLAESLRDAEAAGDRTRQLSVLLSLAWNHYLRERWGGPAETGEADAYAARLVETADVIDAPDFSLHGLCLRASLARLTGRFDDARALVEKAEAVRGTTEAGVLELVRAVAFSVAVAQPGGAAATYVPGAPSVDPVVGMSTAVAAEALTLAGRTAEMLDLVVAAAGTRQGTLGPIEDVVLGLIQGMAMVHDGRLDGVQPALERALRSARAMASTSGSAAALSLLAEVAVRTGGEAPPLPDPPSGGVARALWLRARAIGGDDDAAAELAGVAERLRAPALALPA